MRKFTTALAACGIHHVAIPRKETERSPVDWECPYCQAAKQQAQVERIAELEATEGYQKMFIAELEFKAKAYDAMCEVGLIQYDENIENHIYSVWGFGAWHHDHDILKAIGAAMEPPRLKEPAQALQDKP